LRALYLLRPTATERSWGAKDLLASLGVLLGQQRQQDKPDAVTAVDCEQMAGTSSSSTSSKTLALQKEHTLAVVVSGGT
jgi:hypothetical protein